MTRLLCKGRGHHLLSIIYLFISSSSFLFISLFLGRIYNDHVERKHNKERTEETKQMDVQKWTAMMMMMMMLMVYIFLYAFDMMWHLLIFILRLIVSCGIEKNE
jgi:amino acid permease